MAFRHLHFLFPILNSIEYIFYKEICFDRKGVKFDKKQAFFDAKREMKKIIENFRVIFE